MRIIPYDLWNSVKSPFEDSNPDPSENFRRSWTKIFFPKLRRKCECTGCNEDTKVQEFFTKKRYWWTHRTLWFENPYWSPFLKSKYSFFSFFIPKYVAIKTVIFKYLKNIPLFLYPLSYRSINDNHHVT